MAWPDDYIPGTARVLPTDYNVSILGTDYTGLTAIKDWIDAKVNGQDYVSATKGEILLVPEGYTHTETWNDSYNLNLANATTNSDYFAAIVGENPNNKPTLNLTNGHNLFSAQILLGNNDQEYYSLYDVIINSETASEFAGNSLGFRSSNARVVGVEIGDLLAPNALYCFGIMFEMYPHLLIDCIINGNFTCAEGGYKIGFLSSGEATQDHSYIINTVVRGEYDFSFYCDCSQESVANPPMHIHLINCVSINNTGVHFYEQSPDILAFNKLNCLENPSGFDSSGYRIIGDNLGTNCSIKIPAPLSFSIPEGSGLSNATVYAKKTSDDSIIDSVTGVNDGEIIHLWWENWENTTDELYLEIWMGGILITTVPVGVLITYLEENYGGVDPKPTLLYNGFSDDINGVEWTTWGRSANYTSVSEEIRSKFAIPLYR